MTVEKAIKELEEQIKEREKRLAEVEFCSTEYYTELGGKAGIEVALDIVKQIDKPKWQTVEPTENGLYVVKYYPYNNKTREPAYCIFKLENGIWVDFIEGTFHHNKTYAYAWHRIEPYEY